MAQKPLDCYSKLGYPVSANLAKMEVKEQIALFKSERGAMLPAEAETGVETARTRQRRFGAYYTPHSATDLMADWVVRRDNEVILEPSFGDGAFIRAINRSVRSRGLEGVNLLGVEIDEDAVLRLNGSSGDLSVRTVRSDFLKTAAGVVDGAIGNPPYVRLRHLDNAQRENALRVARNSLGHKMATSGSLWMPFVLHAMESLKLEGRLAMVLPYEFTYVKYALPLWRKLASSFRSLEVQRSKERLFPDVMQEVVILYADGYGGSTNTIDFKTFETVSNLVEGVSNIERTLTVIDVLDGQRVFVKALLSDDLTDLLDLLLPEKTRRLEMMAKIRIGYVTGDKNFFHPDDDTIDFFSIRPGNIVKAITSTKSLSETGVKSSTMPEKSVSSLFLPQKALTRSEASYVERGESEGVNQRYKCKIRSPWYSVPGVKTPDLIMSVFSERPLVVLNDAGYAASNSLICGYMRKGFDPEAVVTAWYTSLTLLQCEMEVHSLGGGVMVLIPGEANKIRLPTTVCTEERHLATLGDLLASSKTDEAYLAGNQFVLQHQLGMSAHEIDLIQQGINDLMEWRTAYRG